MVRNLPSNKAPGMDKISARILKDSLPVILPVITTIINGSFSSNIFARAWKTAEVVPVPKSGDPEESGNNRPISLLPVLSKIAERLAHKQFVDYLTLSKKLSIYQSGNRKLHSTETALLHVTDELLKAMDDKKASILVLLDMSKVFDSIRHDIMLSKLLKIGVLHPHWIGFVAISATGAKQCALRMQCLSAFPKIWRSTRLHTMPSSLYDLCQ